MLWVASQVSWLFFVSDSGILNIRQALYLHRAYALEFLGQSTFVPGLWLSSLLFFGVNVWILGIVIDDIGGLASKAKVPGEDPIIDTKSKSR